MEFRRHTLPNGLEIIAECNPSAYSTAVGFFVKTGARDETDELSGVSHFLEHMLFKGTPTRSAADVNRELDEIGSHSNAYTSEEQTVYYATVLPEHLERAIDLLSDILRPSLREDDFNVEKKVILEEIAKYDDQPPYGAHEKCMAAHFGSHPLGRSVLGTIESVGALTPEQMRGYFELRYSPGNIVLCVAGKVDFDKLIALAERHCGHWPSVATSRELSRAADHSGFALLHKSTAAQQYMVEITNFPAAEDDDRHAARLLSTIIGDDTGSRMFWELIDTGRAEYASLASYEYQGAGILMTFLCCAAEDARENHETIETLIQDVYENGVEEGELVRAKSKICSHLVLHSERPSNRMFSIGNNWVQRRAYRTVREAVESYRKVTLDDLAALLGKYSLTTRTSLTVGPLKKWK